MKLYYIILVMLLNLGCKEEKPVTLQPETNLDIVWKKKYSDLFNSSMDPVLYNEKVVFSKLEETGSVIKAYNKNTGDIIWGNSNITGDINGLIHSSFEDNYLGLCNGGQVHMLDMDSGEKIWTSDPSNSMFRINIIDKELYYTIISPGVEFEQGWLSKTNVDNLNWETVFHLENENGYPPALEMPSLYVADNNDSILIFQNRTFGFSSSHMDRVDLYAFNTSTNNIEWRLDSITPTGASSVHLPLVIGAKVYLEGGTAIICIDIPSGEVIWQYNDDSNALLLCNLVFAEDKIIVNAYTGTLFALDANTGDLIWKTENAGHTALNMVYYNGNVFYGSDGKLFAVQVSDGDIKWEEYPPGQTSAFLTQHAFTDGVTIDQETGYLYTNDGFNVMCIKIPDDL